MTLFYNVEKLFIKIGRETFNARTYVAGTIIMHSDLISLCTETYNMCKSLHCTFSGAVWVHVGSIEPAEASTT